MTLLNGDNYVYCITLQYAYVCVV